MYVQCQHTYTQIIQRCFKFQDDSPSSLSMLLLPVNWYVLRECELTVLLIKVKHN